MYLEKRQIIPIYKIGFIIVLSDEFEQFRDKYNLQDAPGNNFGTTYDTSIITKDDPTQAIKGIIIYLNPISEYNFLNENVIVHECFHAADYVFRHIGTAIDDHTCEPFSYLNGWIAEQVFLFLKESKIEMNLKFHEI